MQIDWLTVAAQVVNFLVLVYLLKRFLYKPVTAAMARREERIAERLEESREREMQAEQERKRLHERMQRLEERREAILEQARVEAEAERRRLLEQSRAGADDAQRRWQQQMQAEQAQFLDALTRRTADGFEQLARKALADLADAQLEQQMIQTLHRRLQGMDEASLHHFRKADGPISVATSFALDDDRRDRLRRVIQQQIGPETEVAFRESSDLLCGVELDAGGHRLGWSLADYLDRFEARIADSLDAQLSAEMPETAKTAEQA
jgi:F-type H+-transporting ATPase subunit b